MCAFHPAGRRLADQILKEVRDHEARAMQALAPEELSGMLRSMRRLSEAMERSVTGDVQSEGGSA